MCSYFPWPCCPSLSNHHLARDTTIIQILTPCNTSTDRSSWGLSNLYFNMWLLAGLLTHRLNFSCLLTRERHWTGVKGKLFRGLCASCLPFLPLRLPQPSIMTSRPFLHVLPPNLWAPETAKRLGRGWLERSDHHVFIERF